MIHLPRHMEQNTWLEFVGDAPINRLLDLFLTGRDFDYTLTDLAKKAGISWSTLHRIFPRLVKSNIVILTREVGRAKLYKLNKNHRVVKRLVELHDAVLEQSLTEAEEKQMIVVHH